MIAWRRSSRSSSQATDPNCVEVAALAGGIGIRDSKQPEGESLVVDAADFGALVQAIKTGKYTG